MSESKRATATHSDEPPAPDEIGWDPDEAPELDDDWFERADRHIGEQLVRRGKRAGVTEEVILPLEVTEPFRSGGPDWQIRIEAALREWMAEHPERI